MPDISFGNMLSDMKQQYYSDKFNDLNDSAIDEKGRKIYVLADNKIFVIENLIKSMLICATRIR